jgi:glycosyltransferase involved in cell wall biosynthesis
MQMARPISPMNATKVPHISVCICTFKRAELLTRLLERLSEQQTDGLFTFSAVVADNDSAGSAQPVVAEFSPVKSLRVTYCLEPQQNIALARNAALRHADGDFIAFIDDDEFPAENWLRSLYHACVKYEVAGVLGPVKPHFESEPPQWVHKGKFFDRPTYSSGHEMTWPESRSGNVLFRKGILSSVAVPFRPEFDTAGEDLDFFRRMIDQGHKFVWCNDAVVYEEGPFSRCNRSYLLRRALLRGSNFPKHSAGQLANASRSLVAVPCYTVALPIFAVFGQHLFLRYLIKLLDHSSRLLAFLGFKLVSERHT